MKNWYTEKITIDDSFVDFSKKVSVMELMKLFEIAAFKHSNKIGIDHMTMEKKNRAFWVVTKMKVILLKPIVTEEKISVTTWTREVGSARALRDCVIKSGRVTKAKFLSEWCCLDWDTRKLRRMNTIDYPKLEMEKTNYIKTDFTNMREEVSEKDYIYTRTIRSTDIDVNMHTNNLKYNYMAFDAISIEELKCLDIKEYEIYFINETHEGDKINIYKKQVGNYIYIEGRTEEKTIFKSVIKFKKKEND